jgi:hypothetical protein
MVLEVKIHPLIGGFLATLVEKLVFKKYLEPNPGLKTHIELYIYKQV